jgi:methyl-accepting chemotaxis protein
MAKKEKRKKMKIRTKLFGGFFIVVAIGTLLGVMGLYSNKKLTSESEDILELAETRTSISSILSSHYIWRHGLSETVYSEAAFTGSLDSTACSLGKWLSSDAVKKVTDLELVSIINLIVEPHHFIHTKAGEIVNHLKNGETDEAGKKLRGEVLPKTLEVISDLEKMQERYGVLLNDKINEVHQIGLMFERIIFMFIIVALIASLLLVLIITSNITKPIVKVTDTLKDVSEGDGDLTKRVVIKAKDEMGDLARYFNITMETIKNLVGTIKYKIDGLNHTSFELSVNMGKTSTAVQQITSNLDSIKDLMVKQETSTTEAGRAVGDIKTNIDSLKKIIVE